MFGKSSDITYENMIPEEEFRYWMPTDVIITTFTLDGREMDKVLRDLIGGDIFRLFQARAEGTKDNIRVYYDRGQFVEAGKFSSVIIPVEPEKNFRFHPKVILIRYKAGEAENKKVKYFISVSSSNISASSSVEAYFAASGEVGEKDGNGSGIADFLENDIPHSDANERIIGELKRTEFNADGCSDIEFLRANEVVGKLAGLGKDNGLLIVSPFLNIDALYKKHLEDNIEIAGIYSKEDSFASIKKETYDYFKSKLYVNRDKTVHAKVYCYKKDGKTHWIIGSSNATQNGFYRNKVKEKQIFCGNTEFNVYFTTKEDDYEKFRNILWHEPENTQKNNNNNEDNIEDFCLFKKYYPDMEEIPETDANNKSDNFIYFVINNLSVEDGYIEKEKYKVKVNIDEKLWKENDITNVSVAVSEYEEKQELKKETASVTLTSSKPFYQICVFTTNDGSEEPSKRLIPIRWTNEIIKEQAESEKREAEIYAEEKETRQLRSGGRSYSRSKTTREEGQKTSDQTPKEGRFEKLMKYCINNNIDKDAFKELLNRLAFETPYEQSRNFYRKLLKACDTCENGDVKNGE